VCFLLKTDPLQQTQIDTIVEKPGVLSSEITLNKYCGKNKKAIFYKDGINTVAVFTTPIHVATDFRSFRTENPLFSDIIHTQNNALQNALYVQTIPAAADTVTESFDNLADLTCHPIDDSGVSMEPVVQTSIIAADSSSNYVKVAINWVILGIIILLLFFGYFDSFMIVMGALFNISARDIRECGEDSCDSTETNTKILGLARLSLLFSIVLIISSILFLGNSSDDSPFNKMLVWLGGNIILFIIIVFVLGYINLDLRKFNHLYAKIVPSNNPEHKQTWLDSLEIFALGDHSHTFNMALYLGIFFLSYVIVSVVFMFFQTDGSTSFKSQIMPFSLMMFLVLIYTFKMANGITTNLFLNNIEESIMSQ
jgi:hypothetical protein